MFPTGRQSVPSRLEVPRWTVLGGRGTLAGLKSVAHRRNPFLVRVATASATVEAKSPYDTALFARLPFSWVERVNAQESHTAPAT